MRTLKMQVQAGYGLIFMAARQILRIYKLSGHIL